MSTDLDARALSPGYLDRCVPADPTAVLAFHGLVAGEVRFLIDRNRVDVGGRVFLRKLARGPPFSSIRPLSDSTHSEVSAGSLSGTWLSNPLTTGWFSLTGSRTPLINLAEAPGGARPRAYRSILVPARGKCE